MTSAQDSFSMSSVSKIIFRWWKVEDMSEIYFQGDHCPKLLSKGGNLKVHKRTHVGEKQ